MHSSLYSRVPHAYIKTCADNSKQKRYQCNSSRYVSVVRFEMPALFALSFKVYGLVIFPDLMTTYIYGIAHFAIVRVHISNFDEPFT